MRGTRPLTRHGSLNQQPAGHGSGDEPGLAPKWLTGCHLMIPDYKEIFFDLELSNNFNENYDSPYSCDRKQLRKS